MEDGWQTTARGVADVERWTQYVASVCGPLSVSDFGEEFRGTMRVQALNGVTVIRANVPKHELRRALNSADARERSGYMLCLQLAGQSLVIQDGRDVLLQPGGITLLRSASPYTQVHETQVECVGVMIPEGRLSLPPDMLNSLIGTLVPSDDVVARTSAGAIEQFQRGIDHLPKSVRHHLERTVVSLFETLCMSWATQSATLDLDPRSHLRESVLRYIDEHLSDPALSPQDIADAHYISLRSLYSLAQQSGTSVAAWVRSRRLEHCRADLSDPFLTRLTVAEIGARWGFSHPPHFTTAFRAAFGETPSAFRKRSLT